MSAKKDTARIDYLEKLGAYVEWVELHPNIPAGERFHVVNPVGSVYHVLGRGATWRDAVDDALAAPQQEQPAE